MGNCLRNLVGRTKGDIIQIDLTEFPGYVDKNKTEPNNDFENSTQVLILNVDSSNTSLKTQEQRRQCEI